MKTYEEQLSRLKEILAVPTLFKSEHELLRYLISFLSTTPYEFTIDPFGNLYITKGKAEWYPLVCAHTDSVQPHTDIEIHEVPFYTEIRSSTRLIGKHAGTDNQCGIGADDKAGVFVCLELLDSMPVLKVALFASEEYGCIGSHHADPAFFQNVGYVMEFDCPGSSDITHYCNGIKLFDETSEFYARVEPILEARMPDELLLHKHPYTDVWQIKKRFDMSCINIATGYYYYHTSMEYVIVEDVLNAIKIGEDIIHTLGLSKYAFTSPSIELTSYDLLIEETQRYYKEYSIKDDSYIKLLTEITL